MATQADLIAQVVRVQDGIGQIGTDVAQVRDLVAGLKAGTVDQATLDDVVTKLTASADALTQADTDLDAVTGQPNPPSHPGA